MKKENETTPEEKKGEETVTGLKKEANEEEGVKKGYNEKNPAQPQGAFIPDNAVKKETDPDFIQTPQKKQKPQS